MSAKDGGGLRNTVYRTTTRSGRRMTPARRMLYAITVPLAIGLIRTWWRLCRVVRIEGLEHLEEALARAPSLVPCYWHQHQLYCGKLLVDQRARLAHQVGPLRHSHAVLSHRHRHRSAVLRAAGERCSEPGEAPGEDGGGTAQAFCRRARGVAAAPVNHPRAALQCLRILLSREFLITQALSLCSSISVRESGANHLESRRAECLSP